MDNYSVQFNRDNDGQEIALVPLSNSPLVVKMFKDDYQELESLGVGPPYKLRQGHVVRHINKNDLMVGRLIKNLDKGQNIKYQDGDHGNLRRDNLIVRYGGSKFKERDRIKNAN